MLRSPIFILLMQLFLFSSCENKKDSVLTTSHTSPKITPAKKLSLKGDYYDSIKVFDSAYYFYNESQKRCEAEMENDLMIYNLLQMARAQQTFGDYQGSEERLTEAEKYLKKLEDPELKDPYTAYLNNLYGVSSKEMFRYQDALTYYKIARRATKDTLGKMAIDNNIANIYLQEKEYEASIKILENITRSKILDTVEKKKALYIDNLGFAYSKIGQQEKGLALIKESLNIRKKQKDSYGSIENYLHLAEIYQDKNLPESKENALLAYDVATKTNSIDERLKALEFLMSYNYNTGKDTYAIQFKYLNDSIKKVRSNSKNQFAKIKYDSQEAKEENLVLKAQKAETDLQLEKQKNQKNIFLFGFILLIVGIAYVINYFKNKNKRERLEVQYHTETNISKKLHDELANDVFHAMTFAETQDLQNPERKEVLLDNLDKIYSRTRNISGENSVVDTGEKFEAHLKEMISSYKSDQVNIIIRDNKDIDWLKVTTEKKIAVHRVVQELLVNMKKHSQCNLTVISFVQREKQIEIQYSDDGKGSEEVHLKNGLQNVENRIRSIKGTVTFDSEIGKGFKVKISFPK